MVNRKGLLRIVEASIAVIIVLGVILVVSVNRPFVSRGDLSDPINSILEEIAKNISLRDKIFTNEVAAIIDMEVILANKVKNPRLNYSVVICDNIYEFCGGLDNYPEGAGGEIYSSERVISTRLDANSYSPKKLKIYLWRID